MYFRGCVLALINSKILLRPTTNFITRFRNNFLRKGVNKTVYFDYGQLHGCTIEYRYENGRQFRSGWEYERKT